MVYADHKRLEPSNYSIYQDLPWISASLSLTGDPGKSLNISISYSIASLDGQRVGSAAVCLGFAEIQQTVSIYRRSEPSFVYQRLKGTQASISYTVIITILKRCAVGKARQNHLCSGKTLRFPRSSELPRIRAP